MNQKLRENVAALIEVFQLAILDLSAKLEAEKDTISPDDVKKTNYVVGMAAINSFNLEQVMKHGVSYYQVNTEKVDRLIAESTGFANALRESGFGLSNSPP